MAAQRKATVIRICDKSRAYTRTGTRCTSRVTLHRLTTNSSSLPSQTATHRTGIPITALDINKDGTHAVLAGKEILKTVRVHDGKVTEELNLRAAISSYASTHPSPHLEGVEKRREYLPARDVKWSTGKWEHIIATAANNGRIALYDLNANNHGPNPELAWLHEHTGQINKLDIDPFAGYLLLSASQDKSVKLWDLREPKPDKARSRFEVRSGVRDVRWSPADPLEFAVCADGGIIQKWDARAPLSPKLSISGHEKACYSLDYHPDGRHVVSGGFDKYIRVWDFASDKKRQKPVFQLRAPHAIRNIRWRPPCRASESTGSGGWQSTQIAVSYYHDDPRLHIWDLRRPHLPFRELDRYNTPANDLLWANKDLLWTVSDDGVFTQWDVKHAVPLYNQIAPSTSMFMPDGEYYVFSEDRELRRGSSQDDPAVGFLSAPREKLSSGDDGLASRSLTDDDEGGLEATAGTSFGRRERGAVSLRSSKSQTNSPPSMDDKVPVLSLDKAVLDRPELFNNNQLGATGRIPGMAAEQEIVEFLATHYATPATTDDRMSSPDAILQRLQNSFDQNAAACDMVSLHRMAQSWRILGAVIVPELKDWADANRARRRADAARRRETLESFRSGAHQPALSPLAGLPTRTKVDGKSQKLMSSLLKGIVEAERAHNGGELDGTSNMTTPLAKPLPNSPLASQKRWSQTSSEEGLDSIAPLPPSVLSSHSTAAAAARALLDGPERIARSNTSSPEQVRPGHSTAAEPKQNLLPATRSPGRSGKRPHSDSSELTTVTTQIQSQENRRAALRDYRAQARPILTLDEATQNPASDDRHGSGESFPMFSASTDSSHKTRSLGLSFESSRPEARRSGRDAPDSDHDDDYDDSFAEDFGGKGPNPKQRPSATSDEPESGVSAVETPPEMSFGLDDSRNVARRVSASKGQTAWLLEREHGSAPFSHLDTVVSTSPDIFHFEEAATVSKPRIHTSNPIRVEHGGPTAGANEDRQAGGLSCRVSMDELDRETYLYQDFRPIDLSQYEPKLPFAWSSLPLICQSIAFDLENGIGHAQFATHLLMHVHPYFFHPSFRQLKRGENGVMDSLADRLMTPQLGDRIIESIFENHLLFLKQIGLYDSAAFLRKICVAFDYPQISGTWGEGKQPGSSLTNGDSVGLSIVCSSCQASMPAGRDVCERCRRIRSVCPICESLKDESDGEPNGQTGGSASAGGWGQNKNLWMFCQACGHSGHVRCLREWFCQPFSEGTCPTPACGCDCGPGLTREHRVQQQMKREEETKLIRGVNPGRGTTTNGSTKRDPVRATPSPAVDKVRVTLRNSVGAGERATQSGDERSMTGNRRGSSRGRTSGFSSSRKSVRLITPGEEGGGPSQSPSRS